MPRNRPIKKENLRLRREVQELNQLNMLAKAMGTLPDTKSVMDLIVNCSREWVGAEQVVINVATGERSWNRMKTLVRSISSSTDHEKLHLNYYLLGWMHEHKMPFLTNSPWTDSRMRGLTPDESVSSVLCVPLMIRAELIGVLSAFNKKDDTGFTEEDGRLFGIIASQSAEVIENAMLHEKSDELSRIRADLNRAAQVQQEILPKRPPYVPGYDLSGSSFPAEVVGGDYFDYFMIDESRVAICLGDVAGHGLPAALLVATLKGIVHAQAASEPDAHKLVRRANHMMYQMTGDETFVTFFYGVLDLRSQRFHFANAGHNYPILISKGSGQKRLAQSGTPLGIIEDFAYEEGVVGIEEGDVIVMFSDGITEACDFKDFEFGEERLIDVIDRHCHDGSATLIERIFMALGEHVGVMPQEDDRTAVVIKREAG